MPHGVVDRLEEVQVQEHDAHEVPRALLASKGDSQSVNEDLAGRETRQSVGKSLYGQRGLVPLSLNGIANLANHHIAGDCGLQQEILSALLDGLDGEGLALLPAEDDYRQCRSELLQARESLEPFSVGKPQVK